MPCNCGRCLQRRPFNCQPSAESNYKLLGNPYMQHLANQYASKWRQRVRTANVENDPDEIDIGASAQPRSRGWEKMVDSLQQLSLRKQAAESDQSRLQALIMQRMENDNASVSIGDSVCLFSEDRAGFVFSYQSSNFFNEVAVGCDQDIDKPKGFSLSQAVMFQVFAQNRYKAEKKLQKLRQSMESEPSADLREQIRKQKKAAAAEAKDNEAEQQRQLKKPVYYGQIIQLKNIFTNKFLHVNANQTSWSETSSLFVGLIAMNGKSAQFRLLPRYKVKSEGDIIQSNDLIIIESIKSPGQFLHVSNPRFPSHMAYADHFELNLSVTQSGFSIHISRRAADLLETASLTGGSYVQLFHKEIEAYLVAEGIFGFKPIENVHLRMRPVNTAKARTMLPPTSSIGYWCVEKMGSFFDGSILMWNEPFRLQHVNTLRYLSLIDGSVSLVEDRDDENTLFMLIPVVKSEDFVMHKSFARIRHVLSGLWLSHSVSDYCRQESPLMLGDITLNPIDIDTKGNEAVMTWSKASMKFLEFSVDKNYDDAFAIEKIPINAVKNCNYVTGFVPFIVDLLELFVSLSTSKRQVEIDSRSMFRVISAIDEITNFMLRHGEPVKAHQKLLRNFKIIDLFIALLKYPSPIPRHAAEFVKVIHTKTYVLLQAYLLGRSAKNELYLAKHFSFFQQQLMDNDSVGLQASETVMELLKDNLHLIQGVTKSQQDAFVQLILRHKNHRYLHLLSVLCVCNDKAVPAKQTFVAEKWLGTAAYEEKDVVDYLAMGGQIGLRKNEVFVSCDQKRSWQPLSEFCKKSQSTHSSEVGEYMFLEHQLRLFSCICKNRNAACIEIVTEKCKLLTFDIAFHCLMNENLPEELRAVFCASITDIFVDVGSNHSVMDSVKLVFDFSDITRRRESAKLSIIAKDLPFLGDLKRYIAKFFNQNKSMVAKSIGRNHLIEQVVVLVYKLADFGYYGDSNDIGDLMKPMLSLIDGSNDKPYEMAEKDDSKSTKFDLVHYRKESRFLQSTENLAVATAKFHAMKVIDILFNFRFNTRLQKFIIEFKDTYEEDAQTDMQVFLQDVNESIRDNVTYHKMATRKLIELFRETGLGQYMENQMVEILTDLLNYDYDFLTTQSLLLLNRYFSANEMLFKMCVETQLLITKRSNESLGVVGQLMPMLRSLKSGDVNAKGNMQSLNETFTTFTQLCSLETDVRENHPLNQDILFNHGVLSDVLDILSREVFKASKIDRSHNTVLRHAFTFLKALSRGNGKVQQSLFDHLSVLLAIKHAPPELGELLIEVFNCNMSTCLQIQINHISRIVENFVNTLHPVWLSLLSCIVLVDGVPVKRNQNMVLRSLMRFDKTLEIITNRETDAEVEMLRSEESNKQMFDEKRRFCSLISLTALCAEGENKSAESICQCIFNLNELLTFVNLPELCDGLRGPFVMFLNWAYLNSTSETAQNELEQYGQDARMYSLFQSTKSTIERATTLVVTDSKVALEFLRQKPVNLHRGGADLGHEMKETLHYIFDAAIPCIYTLFRYHFRTYTIMSQKEVESFFGVLQGFAQSVTPCITRRHHKHKLYNVLRLLSSLQSYEIHLPAELDPFETSIPVSEARKFYSRHYNAEEALNRTFNNFACNLHIAYQGKNLAKHQLECYNGDISRPYCNIGDADELPLGKEFQEFIDRFWQKPDKMSKNGPKQYAILPIVRHLKSSAFKERSFTNQERHALQMLDLRCLQALRAMIHNQYLELPESKAADSTQYEKAMKNWLETQLAIDKQGIITAVLPLLSIGKADIVRESFNLLYVLWRGNKKTPESFVKYVSENHQEGCFVAIQKRIQSAESLLREAKFLRSRQQRQLQEMKSIGTALNDRRKKGGRYGIHSDHVKHLADFTATADSELISLMDDVDRDESGAQTDDNRPSTSGVDDNEMEFNVESEAQMEPSIRNSQHSLRNFTSKVIAADRAVKAAGHPVADTENIEMQPKQKELLAEDDKQVAIPLKQLSNEQGSVLVIFKMLQALCDLQFVKAQYLMREQPHNVKSVNLISQLSNFLSLQYTNINKNNVEVVANVFNTFVEITQGNFLNQMVVFDSKVIDYVNHLLRANDFQNCSLNQKCMLKESVAIFLKFQTEENNIQGAHVNQSALIMQSVNKDALWLICVDCYKCSAKDEVESVSYSEDERSMFIELGFLFFHLLCRAKDLALLPDEDIILTTTWQFYKLRTMSVEIVKNGILHRGYFRVSDRKALRAEVEEKLKWEVDRSTPGNKLRDFVHWCKDIYIDMMHQRKVNANPAGRFLVQHWMALNYFVVFLSIAINIGLLIVWEIKVDANGKFPPDAAVPLLKPPGHDTFHYVFQYGLGAVHSLASFCLVLTYFLANWAGFKVYWKCFKNRMKMNRFRFLKPEGTIRRSKLEVNVLSMATLYYIFFLAASVLGTIFTPALFSFHLLQLVRLNQLLTRVINAVTLNGKSLFLVAIMGIILMYLFSLVGFLVLRNVYIDNSHFCSSLWRCTLTTIREGLIYRLMRIDYPDRSNKADLQTEQGDFSFYSWKLLFDLCWFVLILTIGLNIIFGIIVDTFRQLRDQKWRIEQDMQIACFVCGRNSYEFEQRGILFNHHIRREHSMLSYLFYFVRLFDLPMEDMSALEMYVFRCIKRDNYVFFPLNRAISLDGIESVDAAFERDTVMMKQLDGILSRINQSVANAPVITRRPTVRPTKPGSDVGSGKLSRKSRGASSNADESDGTKSYVESASSSTRLSHSGSKKSVGKLSRKSRDESLDLAVDEVERLIELDGKALKSRSRSKRKSNS